MTIQQIEFFISVAKHLSFTKAADELLTTQPTVSRQISLLEEELGFPLLLRTKRSVWLTPQGAILLEDLKKVPSIIETAIQKAMNLNSSKFAIGLLGEMAFDACVEDRILNFSKKYPHTAVTIEHRNFNELRDGLLDGSFDVIFTLDFEVKYLKDIMSEKICASTAVLVMSRDNPLADKENLSIADFRNEVFFLPNSMVAQGRVDDVNMIMSKYGFTCKTIATSPNISSTLVSVKANKGVALLDTGVKDIYDSRLKYIEIPQEIAPLQVVCVWKRDNLNPATQLFIR